MNETLDLTGVSQTSPRFIPGTRGYSMPFQSPLERFFGSSAECVGRLRFKVGEGDGAKHYICSSVEGDELHFTPEDIDWPSVTISPVTLQAAQSLMDVDDDLGDDDDDEDPRFDTTKVPNFKRVLFAFKVLFSGWECDEDAWVVELENSSRAIVTTSHGGTYVAHPKEFEDKITEYEQAAENTRKALAMLAVTNEPTA